MASSLKLFLLVLVTISVKTVVSDGSVPVFMWGDVAEPHIRNNALTSLDKFKFAKLLNKEVQDDVVIIFEEETLSVEDFSRRDSNGGSSFPYFQSLISDAVYIPSVDSALKTLNVLAENEQRLKLTDKGLSGELDLDPGKYIFISLKDARPDESRSDLLKRHNEFIQKTFDDAKKAGSKVIGIYTAHFPSWTVEDHHTREKRQAETQNLTVVYRTDNILLYVRELRSYIGNNSVTLIDGTITSEMSNSTINATITFRQTAAVRMFFTRNMGYWFLSSVELDRLTNEPLDELENPEVYALEGFSYRCGQSVRFLNTNSTRQYSIAFFDMQLQVYFDEQNSTLNFGDPYYCVGFTSVPIWSGLLITFIILFITMYGVMMMMDIKTMDRFDDPKGKTITITASE